MPTSGDHRARWWLAALLLAAFALRVGVGLAFPTSDFPDETFQTREPAHRLAYGYGIVTWEFRVGARNWVFPAFLAGVMRATDWMGPGSLGYSRGILLALSALSLTVVATSFWWGYRIGGLAAAVIAGAACALWYDLVYYAPQALNEVVAIHLLFPALYLACFAEATPGAIASSPSPEAGLNARRLFLAGILCGATLGLRIHLLPAIGVALLLVCRASRRRWTAMLAGAALPLLVFGVVDWITWGAPFASYWRLIYVNIVEHKSISTGAMPALWLFQELAVRFGPVAVLAVPAIRRAPLPAAVALAVVATHTAFAHKEYRYVYPAIPLLCLLMGLGAAALFTGDRKHLALRAGLAVAFLAGMSALWGASFGTWHERTPLVRSFRELSLRQDVCGVAVDDWVQSGGYYHLHHDVPLYLMQYNHPHDPADFNYIATPRPLPSQMNSQYRAVGCWSAFCLYRREGACAKPPGYDINQELLKVNL